MPSTFSLRHHDHGAAPIASAIGRHKIRRVLAGRGFIMKVLRGERMARDWSSSFSTADDGVGVGCRVDACMFVQDREVYYERFDVFMRFGGFIYGLCVRAYAVGPEFERCDDGVWLVCVAREKLIALCEMF